MKNLLSKIEPINLLLLVIYGSIILVELLFHIVFGVSSFTSVF